MPRVAEHHHESPQGALGASDLKLAEVRPVDLGLLARQCLEAQESLSRLTRPVSTNNATEVIGSSRIAALLDHLKQPARTQALVLFELLDDEWQERVGHRGPRRQRLGFDAGMPKHALHGGVMHAELVRDRADTPFLGVEEAENVGLGFLGNHGSPR